MIKKIGLISFLFVCFFKNGFANYEFDSKLDKTYSLLLKMRFEEAERLIKEEKEEKPDNDLGLLFLNYIDFLKAFISEDKEDFETLKKKSEERISALIKKNNNSQSPFHLYVQSEILIQEAFVRIKFNELVVSATEIRRSYKLIQKNKELFPEFILNKKISGLLNILLSTVPSKYQWILKFAGMEGELNNGINEITSLLGDLTNSPYNSFRPEVLFYLGNMYTLFSIPVDTSFLIRQIYPYTAESPLMTFIYSNLLTRNGRNEEALKSLNYSINNSTYPFVYLYYKRGMSRLRKLDLTSEEDFEFYLSHTRSLNNIKSAYQKLAWIKLLKGDTLKYYDNLLLCKENGVAYNDEDKAANDEAIKRNMGNVFLLRSRLYFDGGYFDKALTEITSKKIEDFPTHHDQLEVTYRLGRILQMKGNIEKAIVYYEKTLENGSGSPFYFSANSALFLGLIYEERSDYKMAKFYFEKSLRLEYKEYKNSIDQKAMAGLERIKKK